jgi:hypothetical protein
MSQLDKGKLAARRGRKATGLSEIAGLPKGGQPAMIKRGQPRRASARGCDHTGTPIIIEPAANDKVRAKCLRCVDNADRCGTAQRKRGKRSRGARKQGHKRGRGSYR